MSDPYQTNNLPNKQNPAQRPPGKSREVNDPAEPPERGTGNNFEEEQRNQ